MEITNFHMKKIIPARYAETVCNIKPKPWSRILGSEYEVLILVFDPGLGSWVLKFESQVLVLDPGSLLLDPRS